MQHTTLRVRLIAGVAASCMLFTGCGGGGSSGGGDPLDGTTQMGGARQGRALALTGEVTTLAGTGYPHDGAADSARMVPNGVTRDAAGNLYFTDNCAVRKLSTAGVVSTFAGAVGECAASQDGVGPAAVFGVASAIASDGAQLYVADRYAIRRIDIASATVSTLAGGSTPGHADGTGAAATFYGPSGLAISGASLYVSEQANRTIRKVVMATGEVTTVAGDASAAAGADDGVGAAARFSGPIGIATDGANLYVADTNNHTIRRVRISDGQTITLAGAAQAAGSADGFGGVARFNYPHGIAVSADHQSLFVGDRSNKTIRKIELANAEVATLAGAAGLGGHADGIGSAARFMSPWNLLVVGQDLYVTDPADGALRKVNAATGSVATVAGLPLSTDGVGAAAAMAWPTGMTTDGRFVYLADYTNYTVRKIDPATGAMSTVAGLAGNSGSTDGIGTQARFGAIRGITTDGSNIYVADTSSHTIRKIVIATGAVSTLAGTAGLAGDMDGTGTSAQFRSPWAITTDGSVLYVSDYGSFTLRKVVIATGEVTTIAGIAGSYGAVDGSLGTATLGSITGITTDGKTLYLTDGGFRTIRALDLTTGEMSTLAGQSGVGGTTDGIGAAALFTGPQGITTDGVSLFITDSTAVTAISGAKSLIRRIDLATGEVTTIAGDQSGHLDGVGASARFNSPTGITTDGASLYVSDTQNKTVRRLR